MRRQIKWKERLEDGVRREVRISFPGKNEIKWQFKRSDREKWDYDTPPTEEDWDELESKLAARTQRGNNLRELELIKKIRAKE